MDLQEKLNEIMKTVFGILSQWPAPLKEERPKLIEGAKSLEQK